MRINIEDCDVPLPTTDDVSDELETLSESIKDSYLPFTPTAVGKLWCRLVQVSVSLGNLLRVHYSIRGPLAGVEAIEASQQELDQCGGSSLESAEHLGHPFLQVFDAQVLLFLEAAKAVLYRPYLLKGPSGLQEDSRNQWQKICLQRAKEAVSPSHS